MLGPQFCKILVLGPQFLGVSLGPLPPPDPCTFPASENSSTLLNRTQLFYFYMCFAKKCLHQRLQPTPTPKESCPIPKLEILDQPLTQDSTKNMTFPVADPGFPGGGHGPVRGRGPPMQALFGKNVCKNERIGSHGGVRPTRPLDPPMLPTQVGCKHSWLFYFTT